MTDGNTRQATARGVPGHALLRTLAVLAAVVLLALLAVFNQVKARGLAWQEQHYAAALHQVVQGAADAPAQFRPLTAWTLVTLWRTSETLGLPRPCGLALVLLQLGIVIALFLLLLAFYRHLGIPAYAGLLGLSGLAWGMTFWAQETTLALDVHLELLFYVIAALLILRGRILWVAPVALLAALNRETSVLIPFLAIAAASNKGEAAVWLPLATCGAVFAGLRLVYGPHLEPVGPHAPNAINVVAVLSIVPLLAFLNLRAWPPMLSLFAWVLLPAWFLGHLLFGGWTDTSTLLLPQALIFLPAALSVLTHSGRAEGSPHA